MDGSLALSPKLLPAVSNATARGLALHGLVAARPTHRNPTFAVSVYWIGNARGALGTFVCGLDDERETRALVDLLDDGHSVASAIAALEDAAADELDDPSFDEVGVDHGARAPADDDAEIDRWNSDDSARVSSFEEERHGC